jgi:hypothetical protein
MLAGEMEHTLSWYIWAIRVVEENIVAWKQRICQWSFWIVKALVAVLLVYQTG